MALNVYLLQYVRHIQTSATRKHGASHLLLTY